MLVIGHDLLAVHRCLQGVKPVLGAEAVVCLPLLDQLFGVLQIDTRALSLTLDIGAHASFLVRSLVVDQACFLQGTVDDLCGSLHIPLLVRILDPKQKIAPFMLRNQVRVESRPKIPHMHPACGAWRVPGSHFRWLIRLFIHNIDLLLSIFLRLWTLYP